MPNGKFEIHYKYYNMTLYSILFLSNSDIQETFSSKIVLTWVGGVFWSNSIMILSTYDGSSFLDRFFTILITSLESSFYFFI